MAFQFFISDEIRERSSRRLIRQSLAKRPVVRIVGNVRQLDKIVGATTRQSIWQMIVLVVSLCGAIVGGWLIRPL